MSTEFGIFTDEGLLEGDCYSAEEAEAVRVKRYAEEDAHVAPICEYHPGQESTTCEGCLIEEEEDQEEDDGDDE